jgi:uncharacterized protein (DUF433 family)
MGGGIDMSRVQRRGVVRSAAAGDSALVGGIGMPYARSASIAGGLVPIVAERTILPSQPAPLIVSDPRVMMGKPTIADTRITVEHVLEELGSGRSMEDLLSAHPRLTRAGIEAALRFDARVLRSDEIYPSEGADR